MSNFKVKKTEDGIVATQGDMTETESKNIKKRLKKSSKMNTEESMKSAMDALEKESEAKKEFLKLQNMFAKGSSFMKENYSTQEIKKFMDRYKMLKDLYSFKEGGLTKQMEIFDEGGLKDEGGEKDPISGNDVPVGSTKKEVRDDIPAQLSEGEFVFPADVVRYLGLDFLMKLRQKAKAGLKRMEEMGQMGNSEEATLPDDIPFTLDDLDVEEDGRLNFSEGGVADEEAGVFGKPTDTEDDEDDEASFQDLVGGGSFGKYDELRKFVGPNGEIRYIPFKDGEPLPPYKDIVTDLTDKGYEYTPPSDDDEDDKKPKEEEAVEEVKEDKDREKELQTAKEDKERRDRSLDNAVQQAIQAGMSTEQEIIDWIKGGNVKVGKFKVPGFLYNNLPTPGEEFGPITNAINRNKQAGASVPMPISKPKDVSTLGLTDVDATVPEVDISDAKAVGSDVVSLRQAKAAKARIERDRERQLKKLDQQIAEYTEELDEAGETISEQDTTIKSLEDQKQKIIEDSNNKIKRLDTEIANLTGDVKDKETVIEDYKTSETALKEQISNLQGEKERLQQQVNSKDQEIKNKDDKISNLANQIASQSQIAQTADASGSSIPNVIKTDQGTTFKGGKLTTDNKGNIVKVNDRPVVVKDDRDRDRPSGGGTPFSKPEPKVSTSIRDKFEKTGGGGYTGGGRYGGFNTGGLASKKPKKKKVMKRGGLASKK
jgi:hypothetical protein